MDMLAFEEMLDQCTAAQLQQVRELLQRRLPEAAPDLPAPDPEDPGDGRNRRREQRFTAQTIGVLNRVTDVRPGEPKQFTVTILNVSRQGVCFSTDLNFPYSRIVELSFRSPYGRPKRCTLEVVRLTRRSDAQQHWLEVGCHSVDEAKVRRLTRREDRVAAIRAKLEHGKHRIYVYIVGPENPVTTTMLQRIEQEGYQVRHVDKVGDAIARANKTSAQLAIFVEGSLLARSNHLLRELRQKPASLATMAVVETERDRLALFQAGLDECLLADNIDQFLLYGITRALLGHAVRNQPATENSETRGLIITADPTRRHLLAVTLEQNDYRWRHALHARDIQQYAPGHFSFVMADFDPDKPAVLTELSDHFGDTPVIALCNDLIDGHFALAHGANDYLAMPPTPEDIRAVMQGCLAARRTAATTST